MLLPSRYFVLTLVSVLVLTCIERLPAHASDEVMIEVKTESGSTMRTGLTGDQHRARANVILLVGGEGILKISNRGRITKTTVNFLVRTRQYLAKLGFLAAVVDAPMDRWTPPGLLNGFRASQEHAKDLVQLAEKLYDRNRKPVIVIGTSRGTVSAANLALRDTSGYVRAVVLTSSLVKPNKKGSIITDLPLAEMSKPILFVHNRGDRCGVTLFSDVLPIVSRLTVSHGKTDLITVNSSARTGRHCGGNSPHGFLGIEQQVIDQIVAWIERQL